MNESYDFSRALAEADRCLLCHDAPCSKGCPANTDPGRFIKKFKMQNIKGAIRTIKENNILGGVCGRICPFDKLCEQACSRTGIDKPIHIGRLQRFATDYEMATGMKILTALQPSKEKVALIGGGPASLSAAAALAINGYAVTIFEEKEKAGGVLTYGIVPSRLPQYVVDEEIKLVENLGVQIKYKTRIAGETALGKLKDQGFAAIFVGVGLQSPIVFR